MTPATNPLFDAMRARRAALPPPGGVATPPAPGAAPVPTTPTQPAFGPGSARYIARTGIGGTPAVPGALPGAHPPGVSPPGTQTTSTAGSLQGYTPSTPNAAVTTGAVNGIDPVKVTPTQLTGMQPFIDAAMNQSTSRLDPMFAQQEAQFRQQMVNQGLPEGSQAYNDAYANFTRTKNDAYSSAENAAMGQGLAAQGQAFGQGAQQTQLAQAMRQWQDQYGLNRDQLDLNAQGQFTQQSMDQFKMNQMSDMQKYVMAQGLLQQQPNMAPSQIDTYSPYSMQQQSVQAHNANAANQSNGFWGSVGQLGSAWLTA